MELDLERLNLDYILNEKQLEALNVVKKYKNLFLTGSPGTGKSFTLFSIVKYLKLINIKYGITALTGCAAILINAQTLHSFLGLGIGRDSAKTIYQKITTKSKHIYYRLKGLKTLIIDEISMMDDNLFNKISELLSMVKENDIPFGGIQLILVGDFCQLPPINGDYCFTTELWNSIDIVTIELQELVRQQEDKEFQEILQEIRRGKCSKKTYKKILKLKNTEFKNNIIPTRLYPINVDVDKINNIEFEKMCKKNDNNIMTYNAYSSIKNIDLSNYQVQLTENIQIMITRNIDIDSGLVNGTRGVVVKLNLRSVEIKDINGVLHNIEYYKDINDNDTLKKSFIEFLPLKLAYALSIHKSQGMTIDALEIDLGCNIFIAGQLYTALSRAKKLESVKILDLHPDSFITHPKVKKFYNL